MMHSESGDLTPFETAERIFKSHGQVDAKLNDLLQIIREKIGHGYYILFLEHTYMNRTLMEKPKKEEDTYIIISEHVSDVAVQAQTMFSEKEAALFFSQLGFSPPFSFEYCLVSPLNSGNIGFLCVCKGESFTHEEMAALTLFSSQIATALYVIVLESTVKSPDSADYLEAMIQTTEEMLYLVGMDSTVVFANKKAETVMGPLIGKHFWDFLVPSYKEMVKKEFEKQTKGETSSAYKVQVFDKYGEKIWLEVSSTPFFDQGTVTGLCGSARIITEKMQIEQQRQHLTAIANDILQRKNLEKIMDTVANAIHDHCGYQRVIISLLDESFESINAAYAGLSEEEKQEAAENPPTPNERKNIFQQKYKMSQSFYIPHDKTPWEYTGVKSKMKPEQMKDWHPDDFLFIPLYGQHKKVIGFISVDDPANGKAPSPETLAPVELFATQAAIAIENARLYEQISRHAEELKSKVQERTRVQEALLETSYRLREITSWEKGMKIILEGITQGLGFENAELFLVNEAEKILKNIAVIGAETKSDIPLTDTGYIAAQCVREKTSINIENASTNPRVHKQIEPVLEAFAWVPIMIKDTVLGAISVYNLESKRPISDEEVDDLVLFANQAAHFVESTRFLISPVAENTLTTEMKYKIEIGESYLVEGKEPSEAFEIFKDAVTHGAQGFAICRIHPAKVRRRHGLKKTPIMWLSTTEADNSLDPKDLAKINHMLNEFLKRASNSIILLEGIEYLTIQNSFEKVIKALHSLNDYIVMSNSRLLVPVNPKTLEKKEVSILEKEFNVF